MEWVTPCTRSRVTVGVTIPVGVKEEHGGTHR